VIVFKASRKFIESDLLFSSSLNPKTVSKSSKIAEDLKMLFKGGSSVSGFRKDVSLVWSY